MDLLQSLRTVLSSVQTSSSCPVDLAQLVRAYNNDPTLYRQRNRRPRTDLMLRGLENSPFQEYGLIAQAAAQALGRQVADVAFESGADIGLSTGNWWTGDYVLQLVVEVENNWAELWGTIHDLMRTQARRKWGVFYKADLASALQELQAAIHGLWTKFKEQGLQENPVTDYEIVVLPDHLPETGMSGIGVVYTHFQSAAAEREVSAAQAIL